jgi:nucleoside-diphosphate-sugar epimerase
MRANYSQPVNVGSDEMVSINGLARLAAEVARKSVKLRHIPGPLGVRGRNSDNRLIAQVLGWRPNWPLRKGVEKTYAWIELQVRSAVQKVKT